MTVQTKALSQSARAFAAPARWAGILFVATAALTIALAVVGDDSTDLWQVLYWISTVTLVGAAGLMTVSVNALRKQYESRVLGISVVLAGIGTVASMIAWAFPLWGIPLGLTALFVGSTLLKEEGAPSLSVILSGFSMTAGLLVFLVLNWLEVGTLSSYGDYPVAITTGVVIMLLGTGVGLIGVGRRIAG